MIIRDVDDVCIVDMAGKAISQADITKLRKIHRDKSASKRIGVDLSNVRAIEPEFLSLIKDTATQNKISVFNADTDIFLQLFVSNTDKFINLYLNESDFREDKRSIVHRRFQLVKTA